MKKLVLIFLFLLFSSDAFAIEEVVLKNDDTFFDYLSNVYYGKVENSDKISSALKLFSKDGYTFDNSVINAIKLSFLYSGTLTYNKVHNKAASLVHDFDAAEPKIKVNFNDYKSEFGFSYNFLRDFKGYDNSFTHRIVSLYISHNITENQKIEIGQGTRLPYIHDGSLTTMKQDFVLRSQIGRTFANVRAMGIRDIASYKYIDYDIGLYDSTRYMKDFGEGIDFSGSIKIKPFAGFEDKIGSLYLGSGYNLGNYRNNYSLYSLYTEYNYKKLHFKTEYADANGYNGVYTSNNDAKGLYSTLAVDINPKLQILGRYDYYKELKHSEEYTLGLTYKPFENMKLILNYVRTNMQNSPDSNMIIFATRFII